MPHETPSLISSQLGLANDEERRETAPQTRSPASTQGLSLQQSAELHEATAKALHDDFKRALAFKDAQISCLLSDTGDTTSDTTNSRKSTLPGASEKSAKFKRPSGLTVSDDPCQSV